MNNTSVLVFEDQVALTTFTAAFLAHAAREAVAERGRCIIALSGGGTPRPVYKALARDHRDSFPWSQTWFLPGDERLVPAGHPESNLYQAKILMLDPAGVPAENLVAVNSNLDPEAAALDYARRLQALAEPGREWPRLDVALNGIGTDGHTASLFPAAEIPTYDRPVVAVTAGYADRHGPRPANRVTLTPLLFNDARNLVFLVTGSEKAAAVAAALDGAEDPAGQPTNRLRPHSGRTFWLLDQPAAADLKLGTQIFADIR